MRVHVNCSTFLMMMVLHGNLMGGAHSRAHTLFPIFPLRSIISFSKGETVKQIHNSEQKSIYLTFADETECSQLEIRGVPLAISFIYGYEFY